MEKSDIRMRGFLSRTSVKKVLALIDENCYADSFTFVPTVESIGRILGEELVSSVNVPSFDRSAMDGYALKGEETFGAGIYNPLVFRVIGQIMPGESFKEAAKNGEAVRIMTGAPMPKGTDAVLMVEYTESEGELVKISEAVAPSKNVGKIGEDIKKGEVLFKKGRKIRPQDAAVIVSVGIGKVKVTKQPLVDLFITGKELIEPGEIPSGVRIVDSNSVILRGLVDRDGGIVNNLKYLKDDRDSIGTALEESKADVICITGGTSMGVADHVPTLVKELGKLLVHGISMRPASPTGFGLIHKKKVFLLPGNPVSCLSAYDIFVGRALRILGGRDPEWPYLCKTVKLTTKISSQIGRLDYVRLKIDQDEASTIATSGASILSSTTRADGFLITPEESEGLAEGENVKVWLYD